MPRIAIATFSLCLLTACTALAQPGALHGQREIGYPQGSLGHPAIASEDWQKAEALLQRDSRAVRADDPARLLNLAHVYKKTGRADAAAELYARVLAQDEDVELRLADGRVGTAKALARQALARIAPAAGN